MLEVVAVGHVQCGLANGWLIALGAWLLFYQTFE